MTRRGAAAALGLLLGSAGTARAERPYVAVVVGADQRPQRAAVAAIEAMPGILVQVFPLYRGTAEVDRAVESLRRFPFDAVVALGRAAHEFCRESVRGIPYAATLVLGDPKDDAALVPFQPTVEEWASLLDRMLPEGARVGTLATGAAEARRREALREALARRGRDLTVETSGPGHPVTRALRDLLSRVQALYFPRDYGLLRDVALVEHLLKEAHRRGVPVFSFTPALVRQAGAVVALHVPWERAGRRAVRRALGMSEEEDPVAVVVHEERARSLGLRVSGVVPEGSSPARERVVGAGGAR